MSMFRVGFAACVVVALASTCERSANGPPADPIPVMSVTVVPPSASIMVGDSVQLAATPRDGTGNPLTGRTVTWISTNGIVASVNAGKVRGMTAGSSLIIAVAEGRADTSNVTVSA